jgi:NitT/TauT family transport system substrate-binding protein
MHGLLQRRLGTVASLAALLLATAACGSSIGSSSTTSGHITTLTMAATYPGTPYAPYFIAQSHGYFAKHGIAIKLVNLEGGAIANAFATSSVDVGTLDGPTVANLEAQGIHVSLIGAFNVGAPNQLIVRNGYPLPNASQGWEAVMHDLRGAKIGITSPGAGTDQTTRMLLKQAGMTPDVTTQIVSIGATSYLPALQKKEVDAVLSFPPLTYAIVNQAHAGVDAINLQAGQGPAITKSIIIDAIAASPGAIAHKGKALTGFMDAIADAEAWIKANPAAADQQMVAILKKEGSPAPLASVSADLKEFSATYTTTLTTAELQEINTWRKITAAPGTSDKAVPISELYHPF